MLRAGNGGRNQSIRAKGDTVPVFSGACFKDDARMTTSITTRGAASGDNRRADATRNVCRILDTAPRLLADDPGIGMAEIAAAAGVARATLYRHFPSREDLVAAMRAQAYDDAEAAIAASRLTEDSASEALRRLIEALLEVGDRYRFLRSEGRGEPVGASRRTREERMRRSVLALMRRGQASGEFSSDFSPRWGASMLGALIEAALRARTDGEIAGKDAAGVVYRTLLGGLSPSRPKGKRSKTSTSVS
jgi:TetR/AcrR family transcriptional repressor of mexCD-oprJ operon